MLKRRNVVLGYIMQLEAFVEKLCNVCSKKGVETAQLADTVKARTRLKRGHNAYFCVDRPIMLL